MTVKEVREMLADKPDHMLVFFDDGENGLTPVSKVALEQDYYYRMDIVVIGRRVTDAQQQVQA